MTMPDLQTLLEEAVPPRYEPVDVDEMWTRARRQVAARRLVGIAVVAAAIVGAGSMLSLPRTTPAPMVAEPPSSPPATGDVAETLTLDDLFGPAWRDDRLYYFDTTNRLLYVSLDGQDRQVVLSGVDDDAGTGGWDLDPRLSPDGSLLVFSREIPPQDAANPGTPPSIYLAQPDGTDARLVISHPRPWGAILPTWAPDMQRIYYVATHLTEPRPEEIHSVAVDGTDDRFIAFGFEPEVSPDGSRLAYENDGAIWTIDVGGTEEPRLLVEGGANPAWSPDGSRLSYATSDGAAVHVINADGSDDRAVTEPGESAIGVRCHPWWSPDGRWVMAADGREVILVEVEGPRRVPLFTNPRWGLTWWWGEIE